MKFNLKPTVALVLMAGVASSGVACGPELPGELEAGLEREDGAPDDLEQLDRATGKPVVEPTPSVTRGSGDTLVYRKTD